MTELYGFETTQHAATAVRTYAAYHGTEDIINCASALSTLESWRAICAVPSGPITILTLAHVCTVTGTSKQPICSFDSGQYTFRTSLCSEAISHPRD